MTCKEKEIQSLQERVIELQRQLAEAQAAIQVQTSSYEAMQQIAVAPHPQPPAQSEIDSENLVIGEAGIRRALYVAPYPLMIRRDDGRVVMINAAWTKFSGYTLEEIPTIDEWTHKAYGEGAPERKSEILSEGFSQTDIKQWGEYEITTRSGEKRIWDFSTAPLGVDQKGRQLMMAMAVDVTERKKSEEELRAARDEATWLARFPGENPNPVARVSNKGVVLYSNSPAASLRGWRCATGAALSRPLLDLVQLAIEQDQVVEQDLSLDDKFYSVAVVPLLKQGYLNLYGRDVTERKQAEKALAESERRQREITRLLELDQARLAAILQYLPVGVWIADQTGRLIGSNEQADQIWAGELPLVNSLEEYQKYESWYPESGELLQPEEYPLAVALRTGQPVEPVELNIRRFDGSEGTVLVSAAPIKDRQGLLTGAVGVNVDISERKQMEEALKASNERVNDILRSLRGGLLALDRNWTVIYMNGEAVKVAGLPMEELIGKNLWELWPELLGTSLEAFYWQAMQEGIAGQRRIRGIQSSRWYDVSVSPSSEGITIFYEDKTEQILAEERFNKAFHASPNALVISHQQDGRIEIINDTFVDFFGYTREEVVGKTSVDLGMFVNPTERQEGVQTLQREGSVRDFELDVRLKSGEVRNASLSIERIEIGGEYLMLTSIQDITLRKQAEQSLRESEERLRRAQQIAHLGSWELDLASNHLMWSDEVYRIFGLQPQEFGASYEAFLAAVHPEDRAAVDAAYSGSIRDGRDSYEIEHRVVRRSSGEIRIVHEKCEHFRDQNGTIVRSIGMVHDITDRKKTEDQLRVYAQRLERSNRELEQFAFMASHDLQEPLRKIEMFGDMLLERATSLNEQERNYVDRMRNASGRMRDMVEGLLQLSRVTTQGKAFIPVDLSQVTSEILHDLEGQIRRTGGRINVGPLPMIEGDALQLHQLMQNLIGNALKYHQPGTPPQVDIYAKQHSEQVKIFVEDKGIGFEQEDAERIFQPFQRLVGRSQYEGSGMGLAICHRIVERHGGEIAAHSKPGHGTTVIVTLPSQHSGTRKE